MFYAPQEILGVHIVAVLSVRTYVCMPAFGTYGLIICMKTVGKLIKGFLEVRKRFIMCLSKLINTSVPTK